jgi:uncharacterized protein (TIGR02118 family)
MTTISVIYPRSPGATFDFDYYKQTHLPLVASRWRDSGLVGAEALRGISAADGSEAAFLAIALIRFQSPEHFRKAVTGEHAAEIMGDIANFTNIQPVLQVNERIGT